MRILVFDTETTGKPKNYRAPITDLENWPRVIQLAWELLDTDGQDWLTLTQESHLVKPDGWVIPTEPFWIENGFNTEKSMAEGLPLNVILEKLLNHMAQVDVIVAHNMAFDYPVLAAEMLGLQVKAAPRERVKVCTMESSIHVCKIPFGHGGRFKKGPVNYKWPKLEELYRFLFKRDFEGAHDAGADVLACRECFIELVKRKVILLPRTTAELVADAQNLIGEIQQTLK